MYTPKVKGIFKGLRYLTQMFDNEKKSELKIGLPTDVKHVAHIGWDGPSVHTPSWMSEFKAPTAYSSAPLSLNGSIRMTQPDKPVKWVPKDSKSASSRGIDLTSLPRSSRLESTGRVAGSPTREKSDRPTRQSRKSSKSRDPSDPTRPARVLPNLEESPNNGRDQSSDIPKKTRRKKSKGNSGGTSSKTRSKASHSDPNLGSGSPARPVRESRRPVEVEKGSSEELFRNLV